MLKLFLNLPARPTSTYPILIGGEMLTTVEAYLNSSLYKYWKLVIITDDHVRRLYGEALESNLRKRGYQTLLLSFPAGEESKVVAIKTFLEEGMLQHHCGRETLILALGGGVVGDLAGFVAATYLRGVPYLQLPTTLLAMVDSSVGGKTGINTPYGKNLLGAFWHPQAVIVDLECLKTLPQQELIAGLIEGAKMFLTSDLTSFSCTQEQLPDLLVGNTMLLEKFVTAALSIKIEVVQRDEQEHSERMILNFGHTIGHALEQISHYNIPHATAVAIGILVESKMSELLGILSTRDFEIIFSFFKKLKIDPSLLKKISFADLLNATKHDKKTRCDHPHYVLLRSLGRVERVNGKVAHTVKNELVLKALDFFKFDF